MLEFVGNDGDEIAKQYSKKIPKKKPISIQLSIERQFFPSF